MSERKIMLMGAMLAITLMSIGVSGLLTTSKTLDTSGSIMAINIGVYSNSACTIPISSLDWGTPEPGDIVTRTVYLKNTGNADMILNMYVSNWSPTGVDNYLSLNWNRENFEISPNEVVQATITLSVGSGITGITDFSFRVTLQGTG